MVTGDECYIKGVKSNVEKKAHNVKERFPSSKSSHHHSKSNYTPPIKEKSTFKRVGKATESSTPLNTHRSRSGARYSTCRSFLHSLPMRKMWWVLNQEDGNHLEDCYHLNKEIYRRLIQEGHLKKYVKGNSFRLLEKPGSRGRGDVRSLSPNKDKESHQGGDNKSMCHMFNTIAWGFPGGEKTSSARERYARQILSIENLLKVKVGGEL